MLKSTSTVGIRNMWVASIVSVTCSIGVSTLVAQQYVNLFQYPVWFGSSIVLSLAVPIVLIALLPMDYVSHNMPASWQGSHSWLENLEVVFLRAWKSLYWITFLLTWFVLPLIQEYMRSGSFSTRDKCRDALRRNLRFQLIQLGAGLLALVYLVVRVKLSFLHLKSMIIAMAHIYALAIALWLIAHGLVTIPLTAWRNRSLSMSADYACAKLPRIMDNLQDVRLALRENIGTVLALYKGYSQDPVFGAWITSLYLTIPPLEILAVERAGVDAVESHQVSRDMVTHTLLASLTQAVLQNLHRIDALDAERVAILLKVQWTEDILACRDSVALRRTLAFPVGNWRNRVPSRLRFMYFYRIVPIIYTAGALCYTLGGLALVESQILHSTRFSVIDVLMTKTLLGNHAFGMSFVAACTYTFLLATALYAMSTVRVFDVYRLVPRKSDPVSACFYGTYAARLSIPLAYNFVTLLVSRKLAFEEWYGASIHLTGLFNALNNWAPRLILLPMLLTAYDVYGRVANSLGLGADLYDLETGLDQSVSNQQLLVKEGKRLVARERAREQARTRPGRNQPYNLAAAADTNYMANRQQFTDSLLQSTHEPYRDHIEEQGNESDHVLSPLWTRLRGAFNGIIGSSNRYSDTVHEQGPELSEIRRDDFQYDSDAEEQLVI